MMSARMPIFCSLPDPGQCIHPVRDECGFSLIEATVAMALLVTVLIPLTGFAVQFMSERRNEHELIALALGRQMMEETLQARSYFHQERWTADGVWRIRKTVRYTDKLIHLQVRVYRRAATKPHVDLLTIRLVS